MTEARAFGMGQYSHNNQPVSIGCREVVIGNNGELLRTVFV